MAGNWRQWHKVLGLSLGMLLLLIALSGGVLVFKENLIGMNVPAQGGAPEALNKYSVEHLFNGLQQLLQHHAIEDIFYLKTPTQGRHYWYLVTRDEAIFLYDATGMPLPDRWRVLPFVHFMQEFHTHLFLHSGGTTLLTLLGVGCLLLMLAGFISWWPGRYGFRLRHLWVWPSRRGPALRQHRAVAILCLPLLLLSVLTGAGMSVQSAMSFFATPSNASAPAQPQPKASAALVLTMPQLARLLQAAQARLPDRQITMLSLPTAEKPFLGLRLRAADEWHVNGKTNMIIDINTGELQLKDVQDASAVRKLLNTFYPLHSSYGLPGLYKTLVALTAVLTFLLGCLGILAWLRRRGGMLNSL